MLTEEQVLQAVAEKSPTEASRESILAAMLTEDEADLLICLRREGAETDLPWDEVRGSLGAKGA